MPRETPPREQATETAQAQQAYSFLDVGVVTSAPTQTEDGQHHVTVAETRVPSDQPIPVVPPVHGDYYVPPEGVPVLVAYTDENDAIVRGSPVPEVQYQDIEPGERVLSHPLSTAAVRFRADGGIEVVGDAGNAVELDSDGTITINGGDTNPVTDVQIDSTNSNGGATSLSLTRATDVFL